LNVLNALTSTKFGLKMGLAFSARWVPLIPNYLS